MMTGRVKSIVLLLFAELGEGRVITSRMTDRFDEANCGEIRKIQPKQNKEPRQLISLFAL